MGKVEGIQDLNSVGLMSVLLVWIVLLLDNDAPRAPTWGLLHPLLSYSGSFFPPSVTWNSLTWFIHSHLHCIIFSFSIIFCFLEESSITTFSKTPYPLQSLLISFIPSIYFLYSIYHDFNDLFRFSGLCIYWWVFLVMM